MDRKTREAIDRENERRRIAQRLAEERQRQADRDARNQHVGRRIFGV